LQLPIRNAALLTFTPILRDSQPVGSGTVLAVTGHANGKSVIKSDEVLSTYHFKAIPGFGHTMIWASNGIPNLSDEPKADYPTSVIPWLAQQGQSERHNAVCAAWRQPIGRNKYGLEFKVSNLNLARSMAMARKVLFHQTGNAEVLQIVELPTPEPGAGEVRLGVRALCPRPRRDCRRAGGGCSHRQGGG
jgi:hypothetical protein